MTRKTLKINPIEQQKNGKKMSKMGRKPPELTTKTKKQAKKLITNGK